MKKNNHISAYLTDETLQLLQLYALDHRWTLSTAVSAILEDFLQQNAPAAPAEPVREEQAR